MQVRATPAAMNALSRFQFVRPAGSCLLILLAFGTLGPWQVALGAEQEHEIPVTLIREGGIGAVLPNARIRVNGREVASLGAGEKITIYVAPGRVVFGIGAWSTERKFTHTIGAGATQRFRIGMTTDHRFVMTRVTDFSR
jgi:hypothetical protein